MSKITKKVRERLDFLRFRKSLPTDYLNEDVYLTSFPKSGNTWFRFLVANSLKVHYQVERDVNFFSIHDIIPDISISRHINKLGPFGRIDLPRIIKSHNSYNPYYYRTVLLVRNPSDVLVSYYHHLRNYNLIPDDMSLSQMVCHAKYGARAWEKHTNSWLSHIQDGHIIQIFRYEDLSKDTSNELARFFDLLGLPISYESVQKAVELSSKKNMATSDRKHLSTLLIKSRESSFVRYLEKDNRQKLSESDLDYIAQITQDTVSLLGYHN